MVSLSKTQIEELYQLLSSKPISCMILNTCNRTEYYGVGNMNYLVEALHVVYQGESARCIGDFMEVKTDESAIEHMFNVASGLDSKVIGDLEILGQFKASYKQAKEHNCTNGFFEKWANNALEVAKKVRSGTKLTSGTVSLAYAAIKGVKHYISKRQPSVLIIGAGQFGTSIGNNAKSYLPGASITVANRTLSKAQRLAKQLHGRVLPMNQLHNNLHQFDVVISAIEHGGKHLISKENISNSKSQLFIDMSVPPSIDPTSGDLQNKQYISIDNVSHEVDNTMGLRMAELPKARILIEEQVAIFRKFKKIHEKSGSIKEWKEMLQRVSATCPHLQNKESASVNVAIKKSTGAFAKFIRENNAETSSNVELIQKFMDEQDESWYCSKTRSACFNAANTDCKSCS